MLCFICVQLHSFFQVFSTDLLIELSFVILEYPVLSVLLDLVRIPFDSSFFTDNFCFVSSSCIVSFLYCICLFSVVSFHGALVCFPFSCTFAYSCSCGFAFFSFFFFFFFFFLFFRFHFPASFCFSFILFGFFCWIPVMLLIIST